MLEHNTTLRNLMLRCNTALTCTHTVVLFLSHEVLQVFVAYFLLSLCLCAFFCLKFITFALHLLFNVHFICSRKKLYYFYRWWDVKHFTCSLLSTLWTSLFPLYIQHSSKTPTSTISLAHHS